MSETQMKKNGKIFLLIFIALAVLKCSSIKPRPFRSVSEVSFLVAPHIIKKDGNYFLVYQIALHRDSLEQRLQVGSLVRNEKAYYYFIGNTSFKELGNLVLRPLSRDDITDFAENNAIYWLNADKSEVKLQID